VLAQDHADAFAADPDRPGPGPRPGPGGRSRRPGSRSACGYSPCVNGSPSRFGRVLAVATTTSMSASVIRRGRPGPQCGAGICSPWSLNAWMTSRTASSSAATSRAIHRNPGSGRRRHDDQRTPAPDAVVHARRRYWSSSGVNRRVRTGVDVMHLVPPPAGSSVDRNAPNLTHRHGMSKTGGPSRSTHQSSLADAGTSSEEQHLASHGHERTATGRAPSIKIGVGRSPPR